MGGGPKKKPATKPNPAAAWKPHKRIPPPASRPPAPKPLVEPGVIALPPRIRDTFARVQYHRAVQQWEPLVQPSLDRAIVRIEWRRVEDVFQRLGLLPMEIVAAWAIGDEPAPRAGDYFDAETFAPESAPIATEMAWDRMLDVPEGFVALMETDTRDAFDAWLNEALGYPAGGEPRIGFVQFFEEEGGYEVQFEKPISEWLIEYYAGELSLDVPAQFIDAFQVIVDWLVPPA